MRSLIYTIATLWSCIAKTASAQSVFLDSSFGSGGKVITSLDIYGDKGNAMAIQSDGKILLGGSSQNSFTSADFALVRYHDDGTLDTTFGIAGKVKTAIESYSEGQSIAIQNDGKILLGGFSPWFINLARYNSDGNLDTTFGTGGKVITDIIGYYAEQCKSVAIQNDGKIVIGGDAKHITNDSAYLLLARYNVNGTLDSSFGNQGQVVARAGLGYTLAIQNDGKILLGGASNFNFALVRYNTDGTLDNSFGVNGEVITSVGISAEANTLLMQSDGKILLGGYAYNANFSDFASVRYNSNGALDNGFGVAGKVITAMGAFNSKGTSLGIQAVGKILFAGNAANSSSEFSIVRYESSGNLDTSFGLNGKVVTPIGISYSNCSSITIQNNGKILLGGDAYNGNKTDMVLLRYASNALSTVEEKNANQLGCIVFPNPFIASTSIRFNRQPQNAEILISNIYGQIVTHIANISEQEIHLSRHNLQSGIYFINLIENNTTSSVVRLVIEND
jgi:uncharacterized delta-60 repeat protein